MRISEKRLHIWNQHWKSSRKKVLSINPFYTSSKAMTSFHLSITDLFRVTGLSLGLLLFSVSSLSAFSREMVTEPVFQSSVYLEEHGTENGHTVVLVHGTGDLGAKIWKSTMSYLKDSFHVIAFDLPGFGRSEKKNELYSPANYARFLKWLIDEKAKDTITVIGHSMGGAISLYFSGTYPDSLDHLILVDAAGVLHRASFTKSMINKHLKGEISVAGFDLLEQPLKDIKYLLGSTIEGVDNSLMPDNLDQLLASETFRGTVLKGDPIRISGMAMIHTDFSSILGRVKVPTAIIWGEADKIAPIRSAHLLAVNIENTSLTVLQERGHNPMLEDPESFNSILLQSIIEPDINPYPNISQRKTLPQNPPDRIIEGQEQLEISGDYERIIIRDSDAITIKNTTAQRLLIEDANVSIINSRFEGDKQPAYIKDAVVFMTGVTVKGDTAITVNNSNLDLAGCHLIGQKALIASEFISSIVFSVTKTEGPDQTRFMHTVVKLNLGDTL